MPSTRGHHIAIRSPAAQSRPRTLRRFAMATIPVDLDHLVISWICVI